MRFKNEKLKNITQGIKLRLEYLREKKKLTITIILLNIILFFSLIYIENKTIIIERNRILQTMIEYLFVILSQIIIIIILALYQEWNLFKLIASERYRMLTVKDLIEHYTLDKKVNKQERQEQEYYSKKLYERKLSILKDKLEWRDTDTAEPLFTPGYSIGFSELRRINNDPTKIILKPIIPQNTPTWLYQLDMIMEPWKNEFSKMLTISGWNQLKYRPNSIIVKNDKLVFVVEPVSYFHSFFSEHSVDYIVNKGRKLTIRDILDPYFLETIIENENLSEVVRHIRDKPIAYTLGIEAFLVTEDGVTFLTKRSRLGVIVEKGTLAPAVSGGLDWNALVYYYELNSSGVTLEDAIKHELMEKDELSPENIDHLSLYPIAITRNLRYMGKLNFLLVGYASLPSQDLLKKTKLGKYTESERLIALRNKNLWSSITNNSRNSVDLCNLLKYLKHLLPDNIFHHLNEHQSQNNDGNVDLYNTIILRSNHEIGDEVFYVKSEKDLDKPKKYAEFTYSDMSAVLLVSIRALHEAYNAYCGSQK